MQKTGGYDCKRTSGANSGGSDGGGTVAVAEMIAMVLVMLAVVFAVVVMLLLSVVVVAEIGVYGRSDGKDVATLVVFMSPVEATMAPAACTW